MSSEAIGTAAAIPAAVTPEISASPTTDQKYKVTIDGQTSDVALDELIRGYQKGSSATKRFQEASTLKAQAEEVLKNLQDGNLDFFEGKIPEDKLRNFSENYLMKFIEYQKLSPDSKRALELEKQMKKMKEDNERLESERTAKEREALEAAAWQEIDTDITTAFKTAGLKPEPMVVKRVAEHMLAHLEVRGSKMKADDALKRAVTEIKSDIPKYLAGLSPEQLREILPKEVREALRKSEVAAVKAQDPWRSRSKTDDKGTTQLRKKDAKRMSSEEAFQRLEQRLGG